MFNKALEYIGLFTDTINTEKELLGLMEIYPQISISKEEVKGKNIYQLADITNNLKATLITNGKRKTTKGNKEPK